MLIRRDGNMPPGGYYFEDPKTAQRFEGMGITFNGQVGKIIEHRQANPKIYPPADYKSLSFDHVAFELDNYTCTRIGSHPRFCASPQAGRIPPMVSIVVPQCPKCGPGSAMIPKYCATCGGSRILSWKCGTCGFEIEK